MRGEAGRENRDRERLGRETGSDRRDKRDREREKWSPSLYQFYRDFESKYFLCKTNEKHLPRAILLRNNLKMKNLDVTMWKIISNRISRTKLILLKNWK